MAKPKLKLETVDGVETIIVEPPPAETPAVKQSEKSKGKQAKPKRNFKGSAGWAAAGAEAVVIVLLILIQLGVFH